MIYNVTYKLNRDAQILADIQDTGKGRWVRVHRKDGTSFEGYTDCWTWTTFGDDEDADALLFVQRDGSLMEAAGAEIDRFEVLEARKK